MCVCVFVSMTVYIVAARQSMWPMREMMQNRKRREKTSKQTFKTNEMWHSSNNNNHSRSSLYTFSSQCWLVGWNVQIFRSIFSIIQIVAVHWWLAKKKYLAKSHVCPLSIVHCPSNYCVPKIDCEYALAHKGTWATGHIHMRLIVRWTGSSASMTFFSRVSQELRVRIDSNSDVFSQHYFAFHFATRVRRMWFFYYIGRAYSDAKIWANRTRISATEICFIWKHAHRTRTHLRSTRTHTPMLMLMLIVYVNKQIACYFWWNANYSNTLWFVHRNR